MPTTALWPICGSSSKGTKGAIAQVIDYVENEKKTKEDIPEVAVKDTSADPAIMTVGSVIGYVSDKNEGLKYVTGINCTPESATKKMVYTRKMFGEKGRRILWHGYQSFAPGESTPEKVHQMGVELAEKLWGEKFEVVVATHLDRQHLHNHFVINATSFIDGKKFNWDVEYPRMQNESDLIAAREGCSLIEDDGEIRGKSEGWRRNGSDIGTGVRSKYTLNSGGYNTSIGANQGRYTIERIVREDIDDCIRYASDLDDWKTMMRGRGYLIDDSRKYLRIYPYGHSRCIRVDRRFGEDYTLEGIERRILQRELMYLPEEVPSIQDDITNLYANLGGSIFHRPEGIQLLYIKFIIDMGGYYKRRGRAARTHFLLREELIRLDKYIDESRFLIRENINTSDELNSIVMAEQHKLENLSKERKALNIMIRRGKADEIESILDRLEDVKLLMKDSRKNIKYCEEILHRSENMQRKRKLIEEQYKLCSEERDRGIVSEEQG